MGGKPAPVTRHTETVYRRAFVLRLRMEGHSLGWIAKKVSVSRTTVFKDLKLALTELAEERKGLAEQHVDLEAAKLEAFSRELVNIIKIERALGPVANHQTIMQAIAGLMKVSERKARLLGLDAPEKIHVTETVLSSISDEDLDSLIDFKPKNRMVEPVSVQVLTDKKTNGNGKVQA